MIISELISQLERIKVDYGDIQVITKISLGHLSYDPILTIKRGLDFKFRVTLND